MDTRPNEVCDRLIALVKQVSGSAAVFPAPFPLDTQLSELGISSLENGQSDARRRARVRHRHSAVRHHAGELPFAALDRGAGRRDCSRLTAAA